jgi:hypothetical protein
MGASHRAASPPVTASIRAIRLPQDGLPEIIQVPKGAEGLDALYKAIRCDTIDVARIGPVKGSENLYWDLVVDDNGRFAPRPPNPWVLAFFDGMLICGDAVLEITDMNTGEAVSISETVAKDMVARMTKPLEPKIEFVAGGNREQFDKWALEGEKRARR